MIGDEIKIMMLGRLKANNIKATIFDSGVIVKEHFISKENLFAWQSIYSCDLISKVPHSITRGALGVLTNIVSLNEKIEFEVLGTRGKKDTLFILNNKYLAWMNDSDWGFYNLNKIRNGELNFSDMIEEEYELQKDTAYYYLHSQRGTLKLDVPYLNDIIERTAS